MLELEAEGWEQFDLLFREKLDPEALSLHPKRFYTRVGRTVNQFYLRALLFAETDEKIRPFCGERFYKKLLGMEVPEARKRASDYDNVPEMDWPEDVIPPKPKRRRVQKRAARKKRQPTPSSDEGEGSDDAAESSEVESAESMPPLVGGSDASGSDSDTSSTTHNSRSGESRVSRDRITNYKQLS